MILYVTETPYVYAAVSADGLMCLLQIRSDSL